MAQRKLTKQQKQRIARIQEERRKRFSRRAEGALSGRDSDESLAGRVITRHGQNLLVETEDGKRIHCLFRQNLGEVVCGDQVLWQPASENEGVVIALQPRSSVLSRPDYSGREKPLAANISQLVIVLAPRPEPTGYLTDQYLVAAELIGIGALIALNKSDLLSGEEKDRFRQQFAHYESIGYPLIQVSAKREHGLDPLIERLKQHTSILVGQSGVGKSSLINALVPAQSSEVGQLSDATGLGRHTTSTATLHQLESGGEIIDSPGVRSFRLGEITRQQLEQGFREFQPFLGHCRFSNCRHQAEPGCALLGAVAEGKISDLRLQNFLHMASKLD